MKVADVMTHDVRVAIPEMTIKDAATLMAELDAGVLPVCEGGRLVGMVTDRDIAIRGVALGLGPESEVEQMMTPEVRYCFADDDLDTVLTDMADAQVRRMPVLDDAKNVVGIVSIGDIAAEDTAAAQTGEALGGISEPGGEHSQSISEPQPATRPALGPRFQR